MSRLWILSHFGLWAFSVFLTLLVLGLYRQVGELTLSRARQLALSQGLAIGSDAPEFVLTDQAGEPRQFPRLADGSLATVLIFGTPDCPPCRSLAEELPQLSRAEGLEMLFVGGPDSEENARFAAEFRPGIAVLSQGSESPVTAAYKVNTTPYVYVVDRNGVVRAKGITSTADGIRGLVQEGLGKRKAKEVIG